MSKVFLVWIREDDIDPCVVGVTDTREQAEQMIQKANEIFGDAAFEYEIDEMKKNTTIIDDIEYTF